MIPSAIKHKQFQMISNGNELNDSISQAIAVLLRCKRLQSDWKHDVNVQCGSTGRAGSIDSICFPLLKPINTLFIHANKLLVLFAL